MDEKPATPPLVPGEAGAKLRRPKVRPPRFTPDPTGRKCDAVTKAPDKHLCDQPAGNRTPHLHDGKCWLHGGLTPSGPASPHWKHGKNSKHTRVVRGILSAKQREALFAARNDPDLLELLDDIALFKRRRDELLARLGSGENGATWHALAGAYRALRRALAEVITSDKVIAALMDLDSAIRDGSSEYEHWTEIVTIVNHRARLVESERQRIVEQQQVLTAKQAETLMAMLEAAVRKHVSDPATLDAIGQELARTVGPGFGAAVPLLQ